LIKLILIKNINKFIKFFNWGLGIGDWGLGIGDWGLGIGPNPQSPIPIDIKKLFIYFDFLKLKN
jgi:hypothetical protein